MKKLFIYLLVFILIFFVLPGLCTKKKVQATDDNEKDKKNAENMSDTKIETLDENNKISTNEIVSKYKTIKLYHTKTGEIEELPLDEYLYGTVSAEMPVQFELEALKAQAIVSRTYAIYHMINNSGKHTNADVCDDAKCCQAWISKEDRFARWEENEREANWNKIVQAVNETSGKIITYNGEPINAFFHSNSGGKTEVVSNVWGGSNLPYLQSVETTGEADYEQYGSEIRITKSELESKLKEYYKDISIDFSKEDEIKILEYTDSGRVKTIKFGNKEIAGTEIRKILGLKSTNFSFKIQDEEIIFSVIGYGHGVGMSQTGADSMAKNGSSCEEIIKHFYVGTEII